MRINKWYWLIYVLVSFGLSYLFSDRSPASIGVALGRTLASTFMLLLILSVIHLIASAFRLVIPQKGSNTLFVILAFLMAIGSVGSISQQFREQRSGRQVSDCIRELDSLAKRKPELKKYDIKAYCECAVERSKSVAIKDSALYADPKSVEYTELFGPCWQNAIIPKQVLGIDAGSAPDSLPIINLYSHIKVKVKVNGEAFYMIFDTGASDILFPKSYLAQQIANGEVELLNNVSDYMIADGSTITAEGATIKEFTIGRFTIQDVKISLSDDLSEPLLGKSLLDYFKECRISKDQLILVP